MWPLNGAADQATVATTAKADFGSFRGGSVQENTSSAAINRRYYKKVRLAHGLPWEKLIRKKGGLQLHAGIIFPAVQRRCLKQC